jgi:hypothetical protein
MTPKRLILISAIWTAVIIAVGFLGIWYIMEHPVPGARAEDRAARLGSGLAVVTVIGYAVLWFPWAFKVGLKRREKRARQARKGKRRPGAGRTGR